MSAYTIAKIFPKDKLNQAKVDQLLAEEGIRRDANLDYTCALFDNRDRVLATGSCYGNTLRCLAVSQAHQGEGLLNAVMTHLIEEQFARGNSHIFLYSKFESARFFNDLGFHEIVRVDGQLVFMENRKEGFQTYLKGLERPAKTGPKTAALVINANPFTLGHQFLVEKASAENDCLHLFMVSEDSSLVPFSVRRQLILAGTAHLDNVICHDTGSYMISQATFPSYFQKDQEAVIRSQAMLDLEIFARIAQELGITRRYVGEEPTSLVTGIYNAIMEEQLPRQGIGCTVIPRKALANGQPISASAVRQALKDGDQQLLRQALPQTTLDYFLSAEAAPVIERIRQEKDVSHY